VLNRIIQSLFGLSTGQFRQFSPQNENFVSFEISEVLSALLFGKGLSELTLRELFGNIFLSNDFSEFTSSGSSSDLNNLSSQLQSADRNELSWDSLAIDKNSLVIENVNNGNELAFLRSVVNSGNAADLHELIVALN